MKRTLHLLLTTLLLVGTCMNLPAQKWDNKAASLKGKHILVYVKNDRGFRHDNVPNSIKAFYEMGKEFGFKVDTSSRPETFTSATLKQYHAIVFSNTCGSVFDTEEQKQALVSYVQAGGGFVGIHAAGDTEKDWPWYRQLVGGSFFMHPEFQEFPVHVIDKGHPSTQDIPATWVVRDELYFMDNLNPSMRVLAVSDFSSPSFKPTNNMPNTFGKLYPSVWCNTFDGGRQWYTALGHDKNDWNTPLYRKHIIGGLRWVMK